MSNYKEMYYMLFNRISGLIEEMKDIQSEAEEMFLAEEKSPLEFNKTIALQNFDEEREEQCNSLL